MTKDAGRNGHLAPTSSTPEVLFSNAGKPGGIGFLVSAVSASGAGWAVHTIA
jgi:hypothetical protein